MSFTITRTGEEKARAVIANLQQAIMFDKDVMAKTDEISARYIESGIRAYEQAIAAIKSEFSLP